MTLKPEILTAVNNFGLGARKGEMEEAKSDPRGWVLNHLNHKNACVIKDQSLKSASEGYALFFQQKQKKRRMRLRKSKQKVKGPRIEELSTTVRDVFQSELETRFRNAVKNPYSFTERWFLFWSNHFTVSARDPLLAAMTGAYEREAIRPHIFGKFSDLLHATSLHPSMLLYLDNNNSVGPNSIVGRHDSKRGYNENLAREILELHTMGVDGGYDIEDIKAFALALTGWTVTQPVTGEAKPVFETKLHEGADVKLLGRKFHSNGQTQATEILDFLAGHPSTAKFIAWKLARHFVNPNPPPDLVNSLVTSFKQSGGDLTVLARTLLTHPASWVNNVWQYKTPEEYVISIARGFPRLDSLMDISLPARLGQAPLQASSPEGWPLNGTDWINAENLLRRAAWLREKLADLPGWANTAYLADTYLAHQLRPQTVQSVNPSETTLDGHILFFISPEFMRR